MKPLEVPTQLRGPWQHALILTYGVDLPFFENALWRQFSGKCRNKVILADGRRYLEGCLQYAQNGLVRHLNHLYIAEGIFSSQAAHAKLILLTNSTQGRLLVGSGNLSWQGYASGGEQFSLYEYDAEDENSRETLTAFLTIQEFLEGLIEQRCITGQFAIKRIRHLLSEAQTPWLYQSPVGDWRPVRHNLNENFLSQLQQIITDQPVSELWILSPFYDKKVVALRRMLETFQPRKATLLLQPGQTSVDPVELQHILDEFPQCHVRAFTLDSHDNPYVHAKLYLFKLADRAICLQGSSNLSQVAMLHSAPHGNIELANILISSQNGFDYLLDMLNIQPQEVALGELELSYITPEPTVTELSETWQLTSGEWHNEHLHLSFRGNLPDLEGASLVINNRVFELNLRRRDSGELDLKLPDEAVVLLGHPVPVKLRWGEGEDAINSNPVFVCNRASLEAVLEVTDETEPLNHIGDLDLEDDELEELLGAIEASLVIDRQSVWQLANRSTSIIRNEVYTDDGPPLSYSDVDYDQIRQDPKLAQYIRGAEGRYGYTQTRLQIILNAITDHFQVLFDPSEKMNLTQTAIDTIEESEAETEEEREQEEKEKQRRRWSSQQRIRRILKNFIQRYLRGLAHADFQELVGPEVIVQNYIIFSYILWRFFSKDWLEFDFIIKSLLQTWQFFWGDNHITGYYHTLDDATQAQALNWMRGHHADTTLLASLYYSARLTRTERWQNQRFALRDFWRGIILSSPFELKAETLEETWRIVYDLTYESLPPTDIADELGLLAKFETHYSFLRYIEEEYGYPPHSCNFGEAKVRRATFDEAVSVNCLVLGIKDALASQDRAIAILQAWMCFEELDYYRITAPARNESNAVLFYEVSQGAGVYWTGISEEEEVDFGKVTLQPLSWESALSPLRDIAVQLDADLILASTRPEVVPIPRFR